jgi:hypothetical protein
MFDSSNGSAAVDFLVSDAFTRHNKVASRQSAQLTYDHSRVRSCVAGERSNVGDVNVEWRIICSSMVASSACHQLVCRSDGESYVQTAVVWWS